MANHPARANPVLAVARSLIGRAHQISRHQMRDILVTCATAGLVDLDNGWGASARAREVAMRRQQAARRAELAAADIARREMLRRDPFVDLPDDLPSPPLRQPTPTVAELAEAWTQCCGGITVISVLAATDTRYGSNPGDIRYDEPGSLHPQLHASVMFAAAGLREYDYLRRHAARVLIVTD